MAGGSTSALSSAPSSARLRRRAAPRTDWQDVGARVEQTAVRGWGWGWGGHVRRLKSGLLSSLRCQPRRGVPVLGDVTGHTAQERPLDADSLYAHLQIHICMYVCMYILSVATCI